MMSPGISTGIRNCSPWPVNSNRGRESQGAEALGEDGVCVARPRSPRRAISETDRWASANQSTGAEATVPWLSEGSVVSGLAAAVSGRNRWWRSAFDRCAIRGAQVAHARDEAGDR